MRMTFYTAILEVGPGSGEVLEFLEANGCRTVAVELSEKMASVARVRAQKTIFVINDINNIQFATGQFEGIYAGALIHLFPLSDAIKLIENFYSWLKPNGILFVNTTTHQYSDEGVYEKVDYGGSIRRFRRKWTETELLSVLQDSKFKIVDRITTNEEDRQKEWIAFICQK
jgi:ubiquinone/menaquinone biosynthesis C-methylase UbiE